ncbi:MAG: PAS domain S-box protein [Cyclobacteriaceae bacterium]
MTIIFSIVLVPVILLLIQNSVQQNVRPYQQLSHQVNLLLVAAARQEAEQEDDTLNVEDIWAAIKHLDSLHNYDLPLIDAEKIISGLSTNSQDKPINFSLNMADYPGNINDTIILNAQLEEWINDAHHEYFQNNNFQNEPAVAELGGLFYPVLDQLNPEQKNDQLTNGWVFLAIALIAIVVAGFLIYDYQRKLKLVTGSINAHLHTLSKGNIPTKNEEWTIKELDEGYRSIFEIAGQFELLLNFATKASQGSFEQKNIFNNHGALGNAFAEMSESLQQISASEARRRWANEGIANFSTILRRYSDDLEKLTHEVLVHLIKYIDACQGGIFVVNKDANEETYLELTACYAYERKKYIEKRLEPGQSQVGQCYLEQKSIYLKKVPDNYVQIRSGMGGANPRNIFIVPLISNEEIYGVIEIASFKEITDYQREFVEKNAESIASAIAAVKLNENTKKLLQESQMATEQLRAQEEEMRQNMEELAATQEEMKRRQDELLANEARTKLIYQNSFDGIIITDSKANIELFNPACNEIFGYTEEEVKGENVKMLMPDDVANKHDSYVEDHRRAGGKGLVGKVRLLTGKRKNGEIFPLRIKLEEAQVNNQKVFILFIEDIAEAESLKQYLQEQNLLLERNEQNLRSLINNSEDTIFAVDKDYQILVVNEKLKKKYQKLDINLQEGQNILKLIPEDQKKIWKERYDRALAGEKYGFTETKIDPDGNEQLVEVFITPIIDKEGIIMGTSVTARDITAYSKNGEKLEEQIKSIQELVERLEQDKIALTEKLNKAGSKANDDNHKLIKEQISNHEYMLQKLQQNQQKLKAAMQDEKYIMKKSVNG